jgi:hypothetical protein
MEMLPLYVPVVFGLTTILTVFIFHKATSKSKNDSHNPADLAGIANRHWIIRILYINRHFSTKISTPGFTSFPFYYRTFFNCKWQTLY